MKIMVTILNFSFEFKHRNDQISMNCYFFNQITICDAWNSSRHAPITSQFERSQLKNWNWQAIWLHWFQRNWIKPKLSMTSDCLSSPSTCRIAWLKNVSKNGVCRVFFLLIDCFFFLLYYFKCQMSMKKSRLISRSFNSTIFVRWLLKCPTNWKQWFPLNRWTSLIIIMVRRCLCIHHLQQLHRSHRCRPAMMK